MPSVINRVRSFNTERTSSQPLRHSESLASLRSLNNHVINAGNKDAAAQQASRDHSQTSSRLNLECLINLINPPRVIQGSRLAVSSNPSRITQQSFIVGPQADVARFIGHGNLHALEQTQNQAVKRANRENTNAHQAVVESAEKYKRNKAPHDSTLAIDFSLRALRERLGLSSRPSS
jgi:hypothetical protein